MITAEQKPMEEIRESIAPYKRVLVLGCNSCVAECAAGGENEAGMLASALRMAARIGGKKVLIHDKSLDRQCVKEFVLQLDEIVNQYDAILSMACGAGVQAVGDMYPEIPVIPALNTEFLGETRDQGHWVENCLGCGDCMLAQFGGVCPLARCSKQLLNGPCGGSKGGVCEVKPDLPCAWQEIINRLEKFGALDRLERIVPPKDWSRKNGGGPRSIVREDQKR
jgi:ferredoxin